MKKRVIKAVLSKREVLCAEKRLVCGFDEVHFGAAHLKPN